MLPGIGDIFAPGSGFAFAPSATTGPSRSGDIAGSTFGGIQTGGSQGVPPWLIAIVAVGVLAVLLKRARG